MLPSLSAERVKKRPNQVITPYNAITVVRFQSGGSVLHHVTLTVPCNAPCVCREPKSNSDGPADPQQLLRSVFAVRQNLTSEWLSELMIGKFGLALR